MSLVMTNAAGVAAPASASAATDEGAGIGHPFPAPARVSGGMGGEIAVYDWGGDGPGCLLLHGTGDGAYVWHDFALEARKSWRVVGVDLFGHGDSDWSSSGDYSLESHVSQIRGVATSLKLSGSVIMGHSLGGDIAARLALQSPNEVRGLVLVDTGPDPSAEATQMVAEQLLARHRPYEAIEEYAAWLCETRMLARPEVLRRHAAQSLRLAADGRFLLKCDPGLVRMLQMKHDDTWWFPALRSLKAPTLVVRGQASAALSAATAHRMASLLPNGRVTVVNGAGHAVMSDNPAGFSAAVLPFLDQLRRSVGQP